MPEWWYESPTCQWLAAEGIWLVGTVLHACCLTVEIAILRLYRTLPYKDRPAADRSVWILMILHAFVWVMALGVLDGGASYAWSAAIWGIVTALLANRAQHRVDAAKSSESKPLDAMNAKPSRQ